MVPLIINPILTLYSGYLRATNLDDNHEVCTCNLRGEWPRVLVYRIHEWPRSPGFSHSTQPPQTIVPRIYMCRLETSCWPFHSEFLRHPVKKKHDLFWFTKYFFDVDVSARAIAFFPCMCHIVTQFRAKWRTAPSSCARKTRSARCNVFCAMEE